jgi:aldose 1-epimerase
MMMFKTLCVLFGAGAVLFSVRVSAQSAPTIGREIFGRTPDGANVSLYTLQNGRGTTVKITDYGGIITAIETPDRSGAPGDIALGFDTLDGYLKGHPYFGALIGRVANRIAKGRFTLDGRTYTLATNNGPNHLHGGVKGFDKVVWRAEPSADAAAARLRLSYTSADGEEGYPGTLSVIVTYALTRDNELRIDYSATTDKATPVNLTNHAYWNLATRGDVLGHTMTIAADRYTPVDETLIPTGEVAPVATTPFDFRAPKPIGRDIGRLTSPRPGGYDHNFVLNGSGLRLAARVTEPTTGRILEVLTDQPGVQFYTGNFLDGSIVGKRGIAYSQQAGFCLETQHFPDAVNRPGFPSVIVRPGTPYRTTTVYRFATERQR